MRWLIRFFRRDLWETDLREAGWLKRVGFSALRVISHVVLYYDKHQIGIRAAGLSMLTLLAIVPILAVASGVAAGFGYGAELDAWMSERAAEQEGAFQQGIETIQGMVRSTDFRGIGAVGTLMLVWSGLALFARVEGSLNFAWRTTQARGWLTRLTSFVSLVIFVPLLLLGAFAGASFLGSVGEEVTGWQAWLRPLVDAGLWMVPFGLAWIAFLTVYKFLPSASVDWFPALISGVFTGTALIAMHWVYVRTQVEVAKGNPIYGTLAALPLLLVYLQLQWSIVLLGAEIGYAIQHLHLIGPGRDLDKLAPAVRERVAVRLADETADRFAAGGGPTQLEIAAARMDVPAEWLETVAEELVGAGILVRVQGGAVAPARPPSKIPLSEVVAAARGTIPDNMGKGLVLAEDVSRALRDAQAASMEQLRQVMLTPLESDGEGVSAAVEPAVTDAGLGGRASG